MRRHSSVAAHAAPAAASASASSATLLDAARDALDDGAAMPADEAGPRSLFGEILDWMLAPLLLLWPMSIAVTYLVAKSIANGPFDRSLEIDAYVLARQIEPRNGTAVLTLPPSAREFLRADNVDTVYYQVRGARGELLGGDAALPLPSATADRPPPGVVEFRDEQLYGVDIRIAYTYVDVPHAAAGDDALVQVAETLDKRNRLANEIIKGVILPQFVILPLAIVLVWFGLSRGLAPLVALQERIRARRPDDLSPLDARRAPPEIAPLITSFNDLLMRLAQNIESQKRFIADAAHQMKTPLAGLRMQAELAQRHPVSPEVQRSLAQIATSSEHATRLVTQLLALARAEDRSLDPAFRRIDVGDLARQCVQDWVQPALAKPIDLGYEAPAERTEVVGNPMMLREMLSNLVDNAIRYTPAGGRVTIRVRREEGDAATEGGDHGDALLIEVEDTGPGIPAAERGRVIERFYRILGTDGDGSGLGLAIVSEIVAMHHGTLSIHDHPYSDEPSRNGTLMRVRLSAARAPSSRDFP